MSITIPKDLAGRVVWFCKSRNVPAGHRIIDKSSGCSDLFIITRGKFMVHDDSAGEDFVLAMLERGDIFGEMSFLDRRPRSAAVTSTTSGSLLRMGEAEFAKMLKKEPEVAVRFMQFLAAVVSKRLRSANDALLQMAFGENGSPKSADPRLQEAISNMHAAVRMELEGS